MKSNLYSTWGFKHPYEVNIPTDIYIDIVDENQMNNNHKKILILLEPSSIKPNIKKILLTTTISKQFDIILTFDQDILNAIPHSHLFLFGTSWIYNEILKNPSITFHKHMNPKNKLLCITSILTNKCITNGHKFRFNVFKQLYSNITTYNIPILYYLSSRYPVNTKIKLPFLPYDSKLHLFKGMYHLCIENSQIINYFTEKIIDCFMTKTIPIYWGCPNITDFFDKRGFYIVNNIEDITNVIQSLTKEDYFSRLEYIESNYKKAHDYKCLNYRLMKKLHELEICDLQPLQKVCY